MLGAQEEKRRSRFGGDGAEALARPQRLAKSAASNQQVHNYSFCDPRCAQAVVCFSM